jgi:hypothetical protein
VLGRFAAAPTDFCPNDRAVFRALGLASSPLDPRRAVRAARADDLTYLWAGRIDDAASHAREAWRSPDGWEPRQATATPSASPSDIASNGGAEDAEN